VEALALLKGTRGGKLVETTLGLIESARFDGRRRPVVQQVYIGDSSERGRGGAEVKGGGIVGKTSYWVGFGEV